VRVIVDANLDHIVTNMLVVLLVFDFAQLGFLVLDVFDHSAHGQA
jgi:hypothetical protein